MTASSKYYLPAATGLPTALYNRWVLGRKPVPALPRTIQIQTKSGCNAHCRFCPNTTVGHTLSQGEMDLGLYKAIIDQVVEGGLTQRVSPYLMNEPLMDAGLPEKIAYAAGRIKGTGAFTKVNTNGALLDERRAHQLIESGLDKLHVSFHGITRETYEASMQGLSYDRALENVKRFLKIKERLGAARPQLKITMVRSNIVKSELDRVPGFWRELGLSANILPLGNRNDPHVERSGLNAEEWLPFKWCDRLMT